MRILAVTMVRSVATPAKLAVPTAKAKQSVTVEEAEVAEVVKESGSTIQQPCTQRRWTFLPLPPYGAVRLPTPRLHPHQAEAAAAAGQVAQGAQVPAPGNTEKPPAATTAAALPKFVLTTNVW